MHYMLHNFLERDVSLKYIRYHRQAIRVHSIYRNLELFLVLSFVHKGHMNTIELLQFLFTQL